MENLLKYKKIYLIGSCMVLVIVVAAFFWLTKKDSVKLDTTRIEPTVINGIAATTAYDLALGEALKWSQDAELTSLETTATTSVVGTSDDWQGLFVASAKPGRGYLVGVKNKAISEAKEVPYVGKGEVMPEQLISSEEAIERFHKMSVYANEPVLGVEVFYGPDGSQWYWGIKTSKGVVTINARK